MLKPGTKRRRTKIEVEEAAYEGEAREDAIAEKNLQITSLKNELGAVITQLRSAETSANNSKRKADNAEEMASNNNKAADLVNQMMNAGAIQMEADGSISLTGPGGPTNIMGNAE
jgi:hypothetical protein